jgi:uncharacterized damage-inducible protein DinB
MRLSIEELIAYTDEERAKWEEWFAAHGDEPLKIRPSGDAHASVGALILHIFGPEMQYLQFLRDEDLTDYTNEPTSPAAELFAFGRRTRSLMRAWSRDAKEENWERLYEPQDGVRVSARKITAHILTHEIRHWAQIAMLMRQNNLAPPGNHDLLFSKALD